MKVIAHGMQACVGFLANLECLDTNYYGKQLSIWTSFAVLLLWLAFHQVLLLKEVLLYKTGTKHLLCTVISIKTTMCTAVHHFHGIPHECSAFSFIVVALEGSSAGQCKSRLS